MTENFWQKYKKNKEQSQSQIITDIESELKRKFKSEKSPEEMLLMCKTDNNYWKQYRGSENLDDDSVAMVLCKNPGCELMYCQALTFSKQATSKQIDTFGCTEQYQGFRDCYLREKRKFNFIHKEQDWRENPELIPNYMKEQLKLMKENEGKSIASEVTEKINKETYNLYNKKIDSIKVDQNITIKESKGNSGGYI